MKETPLIVLINKKDLKRLFKENKNLKHKDNLIYFEEVKQ
jgi:hypothetical protein